MDNKYLDINGLDYFKNKFERKLESKMNTVGVVHIINKNELSDNQAYRIAKFDLSKFAETDFGGNYSPDIYIDILSWRYGLFYLKIRPAWATSKKILLYTASFHMKEGDRSIYNNSNGSITPPFKIRKTNTSIELYYASDMLQNSDTIQILSYNVIPNSMVEEYNPKDHIVVDWTLQKVNTTSLQLSTFNHYYLGYDSIFSSNDNPNDVQSNGLVPHPTTSEAENKYLLGADAKWHPRKAGNEYIANLKPTEEIKGLSETDTTKGISFVTFDFNTLSQKVVEAAPSTDQEFMINMKVLTRNLGIITISTKLSVTATGMFGCSGVLSDRGMGSHSVSFSTTYSGRLGAVTSPGFFVNDTNTKIFKIALYTPIAIDGVKIIDAVVTSYSDIITESDITFTWELGILEKKPYKPLRSNIIYSRIDLDRELVFDQMNIETPIPETDEDTLFAEQIKHNGLVPAPGKYEVDNQYFLKADGTWDLPKRQVQDAIATVSPSAENIEAYNVAKETKRISFVTIDFANVMNKIRSGKLHFVVSEYNFGTVHLYLQFIVNKTMCNANIFSTLGTNTTNALEITNLMDYGVETSSPIFATNEGDSKNIVRIGFNGVSATRSISILDCYIDSPHDITIDDLVISWESSIIDTTLVNKYSNSKVISYMDYEDIFSSILDITSPSMVESTDAKTLKMYKIMNNGFVPAPYQYEADQGKVLRADGTWGYQHPPIIECSSIENSENLILTSEGEEILEELLSTPCFNFVIKLHGLSTDTFTATSQFAIAKNDRYIKLYDAATSEAIVVLKGGSYVYVTIIKVSENIYHGMCIRHNYNVEN